MKVLIVPNYSRPDAVDDARMLEKWLSEKGHSSVIVPDKHLHPKYDFDVEGVGLAVSLGGDGTLLRAARVIGYTEIPIVGISYGHLGFLTSAPPEGLIPTVESALEGSMHVSHRATLDVEAIFENSEGERMTFHRFALNDFSLSRGAKGSMIEFHVSVSGNYIDTLRGDGFVVSTATGSTGYALAAGGPIVTPEFHGMVCVPVAPHTIMARAFLTAPTDVVAISMSKDRPAERVVFVDGQPLGEGLELVRANIRRGPGDILLLDNSAQSFYGSVSRVFYGKAGK